MFLFIFLEMYNALDKRNSSYLYSDLSEAQTPEVWEKNSVTQKVSDHCTLLKFVF